MQTEINAHDERLIREATDYPYQEWPEVMEIYYKCETEEGRKQVNHILSTLYHLDEASNGML